MKMNPFIALLISLCLVFSTSAMAYQHVHEHHQIQTQDLSHYHSVEQHQHAEPDADHEHHFHLHLVGDLVKNTLIIANFKKQSMAVDIDSHFALLVFAPPIQPPNA